MVDCFTVHVTDVQISIKYASNLNDTWGMRQ